MEPRQACSYRETRAYNLSSSSKAMKSAGPFSSISPIVTRALHFRPDSCRIAGPKESIGRAQDFMGPQH